MTPKCQLPPLMPKPNEEDGWAAPFKNFSGPGYRGTFRMRPRDMFDFVSKLHDLHYYLNDLSFSRIRKGRKDGSAHPNEVSRVAKADAIFEDMNNHAGVDGLSSRLYNRLSQRIFEPRSEIKAGDGFINLFNDICVMNELNDPQKYLMIPYSHLQGKRPKQSFWARLDGQGKDFHKETPYDRSPGFIIWTEMHFHGIMSKLKAF